MQEAKPMVDPNNIKILQVDDDRSLLHISKLMLKTVAPSFDVDSANGVEEAFQKLAEKPYDVIVCDYEMPQRNGLEFLRELKQKDLSIPFILFTGKGREEIAIEALNLGANGYYNKQGSPETVYGELVHGIKSVVAHNHAEVRLIESQATMRAIAESTRDLIWAVNCDDFGLTYFNQGLQEYFLGRKIVLEVGMRPEDLFTAQDYIDQWREFYRRALQELQFTTEYRTITGTKILELNFNVLCNEDRIFGISVFGKDITESKQLGNIIKESEWKYRQIFNTSPDGVYLSTLKDGKIIEVNDRIVEMFGYSKEEMLGKSSFELGLWANYNDRKEIIKTLLSKGIVHKEILWRRKNNAVFPSLLSVSLLRISNQEFTIGIIKDITEQKLAQEALIQSEERWKYALEGAGDGLWDWNAQTNKAFYSAQWKKMLGYENDEIGNTADEWDRHIHPDDKHAVYEKIINHFFEKNDSYECEHRILCKDGSYKWVLDRGKIISFTPEGKALRLIGTFTDISKRKLAEQQLRESEARYRSFIEVTGQLGWKTDSEGGVVDDIPSWRKFTGQSVSEIMGRGWIEALHPEDKVKLQKVKIETAQKKTMFELEYRVRRWDGVYRLFLTRGVPIFDDSGAISQWVGTCIDITERKQAEETLLESEERYRQLYRFSGIGIGYYTVDGRVISFNEIALQHMGGLNLSDVVNKTVFELYPQENAAVYLSRMTSTYKKDKSLEFVDEVSLPSGLKWFLSVFSPVKNSQDHVMGIQVMSVEITKQKTDEMELKESHKKIQTMNEKLHVISSLTRHDIGNKLNIAQTNLLFLKNLPKDDPEFAICLNEIKTALDQSMKIIAFSKQYEKIGAEKPVNVDVGEQFNLAANLRPHGNVIIINSVSGLVVLADSMLQQLFYNLIDNSLKHGKTVTMIELSCEQDTKQIKLVYQDNGQGILEVNKDKIFLEGFTTGGSGLGLKLVKRMIEVYGWTIAESGEPGRGAKFIITIPTP